MKVVLREDVESLGRKGDVLEVADGFARNYLVPRGLAIRATKGLTQQAEAMRRSRATRETREREAAEALASRLAGRRVEVRARAGEAGRLFGSVTATDVAEAVLAQTEVELDRRRIALAEPIRELGTVEVPVWLHAEVEAVVTVEVVAE